MGVYFRLDFKLPFCLFDHTWDTSVIYDKAKLVCFIHMHPEKMKFTSVQINKKHVSYVDEISLLMFLMIFSYFFNIFY